MSNKKNEYKEQPGEPGDLDDEFDEELMALAGPPPSLRYGLFTAGMVILLGLMMVWFYPELEYALQIADDPTPLGDASELDMSTLESNSYVSLDGIPQVSYGIEFKEGVKWFSMSDNARHFFPMTGQSNIYVQWKEPDEYKAFRDPNKNPTAPGPPSHFEGHLVQRDDLVGGNYERILVFYDCLKVHPLRRCNYCLGKSDFSLCRDYFTCAERNPKEECAKLVQHIENPSAVAADTLNISLREHHIDVNSIRLEELEVRVGKLGRNPRLTDGDKGALEALEVLKKELLAIRVAELKIRAGTPLSYYNRLSSSEQTALRGAHAELEEAKVKEAQLVKRQKLLNEYAVLGQALESVCIRIGKMRGLLEKAPAGSLAELGSWNLDPAEADGKKLGNEIDRLEAVLFSSVSKLESPADTTAPEHAVIIETLNQLRTRIKALQHKVTGLLPGTSEKLDKWAARPDVFGAIPAELREPMVLQSISKMEAMLLDVPPSEESLTELVGRVNAAISEHEALTLKIDTLASRPGLREVEVVIPILALEEDLKTGKDLAAMAGEVGRITLLLMEKNLYLNAISGLTEEMAALESLLGDAVVSKLTERVDGIASKVENGDWVLFDKEPPLEKTWVLVIYAVLCVMILVNIRKLLRFYAVWKS